MHDEIIEELKKLEVKHSIKILYAVESGSRAWGFASKDSDWDVRFIYVHVQDWYLSIDERKENIEFILPNDIDLSGWELRKALKLFRKSNPPLFEWLISPIVYYQQTSFVEQARTLSSTYFNPKSCMYHYLSMAVNNYKDYLQQDMVKVKKYFYVLRPLLACAWVEKNEKMPPMEFEINLNNVVENGELKNAINQLLSRKKEGEELDKEPKIEILNNYIVDRIDYFSKYLKEFSFEPKISNYELNLLFRSVLKQAWS
ncbi:nucleotidyltransferase domain-containing protein [Ferruginibacter albus]|uniref:nucleotidyltransferase domain-containing protein n=1 Tax=Ferruginibacter albus TaxID=2875540 RepID=UPI001CC580F9|nr:nucleotidyltransferase domain-containing protein [Ferruginibacter albus]UAY51861.1 nucleotidyltransferase domain-containing protein [Ferruginibacter albus]